MAKPFQKRHANELVGVFVLMTIGILIAAVVFGPNTRRWLTPTRKLSVRLPPEGSLGLRKGADVQILGSVVGSVDDISVTDAGEMEAEISIRGNFIRFVRNDSIAIIRKPLGIGDASIEITRGNGAPMALSGAVITSTADKAPTEMIQETLTDIRTEALPALRELRAAIGEYGRLAADLRAQQPGLAEAIGHVNRTAESVEAGKGLVGMLLTDSGPRDALRESIPKINASIEDVRAITANLRKLAAQLPDLEHSVARTADQAPVMLLQVNETVRQLQRLIEAMQRNWLIAGDMDHRAPNARIGSDQVGTDR